MKVLFLLSCLTILQTVSFAQSPEEQLLQVDQGWEKALLESNVEFLENLVAADFIWVHNHAGLIDGKEAVIVRAKRIRGGQADDTRNRTPRDQQVVILGQTGVVSGYTVVDRGPSPTTYHFMRTYARVNGEWKLLGNHTMAIPED
ncbi:nuclear transport factor 2 family protein [Algoriphagus lacus]|uniref:Nuclear transport factor 2 family protein n=1 Tax=Algoriphagus lacus TaxID=2056311 RepID=A0A418PPP2_9BACT|nr:nuclear transport factor 2 family protein [Algoriphagus lacus]RIW14047.1 nuclear transport factor 2 family protein [Algoriphagus lacus]